MGPELKMVKLDGIDITNHIKKYYGLNNDWCGKLWKYKEVFGEDSLHKSFYIEYHTSNNFNHWYHGYVNNLEQYFNPKIFPNITDSLKDLKL